MKTDRRKTALLLCVLIGIALLLWGVFAHFEFTTLGFDIEKALQDR